MAEQIEPCNASWMPAGTWPARQSKNHMRHEDMEWLKLQFSDNALQLLNGGEDDTRVERSISDRHILTLITVSLHMHQL
jgi:hypothetical protein